MLELLRSAQTRLLPQQILLVKAKAVFQTVTTRIRGRDLAEGRQRLPYEEKPTHPRIALCIGSPMTGDPDHTHGHGSGFLEVQVLPTGHFDLVLVGVLAFPEPIRGRVGGRIATFEGGSVLSGRPTFARAWGSRSVEDPVLGQACQQITREPRGQSDKGDAAVVTVAEEQIAFLQERSQLFELLAGYLCLRVLAGNTYTVHRKGPATGLLGQQSDHRKLPPGDDGLAAFGKVRRMHIAPVACGPREWSWNGGGIHAENAALAVG